jgi:hypothetical protein
MSLLIGGSIIQSPHIDCQQVCLEFEIKDSNKVTTTVTNHEIGRNEFNKIMSSQYGCSGIVINISSEKGGITLSIPYSYLDEVDSQFVKLNLQLQEKCIKLYIVTIT